MEENTVTHRLLLDIAPNAYAIVVVAGMASAGLVLGTLLDQILRRFGIGPQGGSR